MHRARHACLLFVLLCAGLNINAQLYPFVHYTPKDGLVNSRIKNIFQDSRGRMYFMTFGGLSVYDGSRFVNYTTDNGLKANLINDVVEMGDDSIWVITNSTAIYCLVGGKLKDLVTADNFYPVVNKMIKCSDGYYYALADDGLFKFKDNKFNRLNLRLSDGTEANNYFIDGFENDKNIFLLTEFTLQKFPASLHLLVYNLETQKLIAHKRPPDIFCVIKSPDNNILVSTNPGIKSIDKQALKNGEIRLHSAPAKYDVGPIFTQTLYFDRDENLWILTYQGILRIDRHGEKKWFTTNNGLAANDHTVIFQDHENILWFGNAHKGISKLSEKGLALYPERAGFNVRDLSTNQNTDSIFFIDGNQKKIVVEHNRQSKEFFIPTGLTASKIASGKNRHFYSVDKSIYEFTIPKKGNRIKAEPIFSYQENLHSIGFLISDNNDNPIFVNDFVNVVFRDGKLSSYPIGYIADQVVITKNNYLWVATRANEIFLFKINPEDTAKYFTLIKHYKNELPRLSPRSITLDSSGRLWVGSRDHGLFCFTLDDQHNITSQRQFTTRHGLSDNFISYLHADKQNNIWVCSPVGLDKVQLENDKLWVEKTTGSNNIYQHVLKINTNQSGIHWAATLGGVMNIYPAVKKKIIYNAKIFFTEIRAGNEPIYFENNLTVTHKQNDFIFQVAAPTFIDENQTRFSYLLEGSERKQWSTPVSNPEISFANLQPGNYRLRVKASFLNGIYPDSETEFAFSINPPWWQTWFFRGIFILLTLIIVAIIVKVYVNRKLTMQRNRLEKQQAIQKERARIATDMHDDLGAGLSSIKFLSEKLKRSSTSDVTSADADRIVTNSNDLVQKMNEIIWAMNEKNDTLEDLLFYTRSYAVEYCEENNLACTVYLPDNINEMYVSGEIRRNVFLIIKESLHNVVKHAQATGVKINFKTGDQNLYTSIQDNGRGFSREQNTDGNGLINIRKRINNLGGQLIIQNGVGVTIEFTIPLKNELKV